MLKRVKQILNFGISENDISLEEKQSIRLINLICVFTIVFNFLGDIISINIISWSLITDTIINNIGFAIVLYLHYKQKTNFAKWVFISLLLLILIAVPFLVPHSLNAEGLYLSIIVLLAAVIRSNKLILIITTIVLGLLIWWHIADYYHLIKPINTFNPKDTLYMEINYSIIIVIVILIGLFSFKKSANDYQKELAQNLHAKDILIKEVHHRVKNNLQIILSIIGLRSDTIKTEESKDLLKDIKVRVVSMALVHNKLYETNGIQQVDLKDYIQELSKLLIQMYDSKGHELTMKHELQTCVTGLETSIPLGLIITEIITNSVKHAFLLNKINLIEITGEKIKDSIYQICIKDNGTGLKNEINPKNSLGFLSISILSKQIGASVERINDNGLTTIISIKI